MYRIIRARLKPISGTSEFISLKGRIKGLIERNKGDIFQFVIDENGFKTVKEFGPENINPDLVDKVIPIVDKTYFAKFNEDGTIDITTETNESLPRKQTVDQLKKLRKMTKGIDIGDRISDMNKQAANVLYIRNPIDSGIISYEDFEKKNKKFIPSWNLKHLKSPLVHKEFNESKEEVKDFKNTDDDIRMFFTDYIDENPDALTIKNGLVYNGRFIDYTPYMKDTSKYRRAKLITLSVCKADGISTTGTGRCITNIEVLQNLLDDIKRFYALSGEDINYSINTNYSGLEVQFIVLGDIPKAEENLSSKIDDYLKRIKECIKKKGFKRQTINGNYLDMRFPKKGAPLSGWDYHVGQKLRKIAQGIYTLDNVTNDVDRELVKIRNEAWEDGLTFSISGGNNQIVLKLVKR